MSELKILDALNPAQAVGVWSSHQEIAAELEQIGARFERWEADSEKEVTAGDPPEQILEAYQQDIDRLIDLEGYQAVDVVSMSPDHPEKDALRRKFLDEHTHSEDEVRFFVAGQGLFSLHIGDRVYEILCEKGDLLGVPANTRHWFDMGPNPSFAAIRLFNNPDGWIANFTGDPIAENFSRLEN
jgi:1,2-dihydroxy-3-keto-5-methylthiopentene dioxygenase